MISRGIKSDLVFGSLFIQYWCVATKSGDFLADRTRTGKAETWQQLNLTKCLALTNIELNNAFDNPDGRRKWRDLQHESEGRKPIMKLLEITARASQNGNARRDEDRTPLLGRFAS
jgi:hypothetical protein